MLRLGAVLMPLGLFMLARKMPSPVAAFRRAGAYSPETARKPASLGLSGAWLFEGALGSGLVRATADGRYYLDRERDRKRQRAYWIAIGLLMGAASIAAAWIIF